MNALRRLLSSENPQMVFLSETKLKQREMEFVLKKLKIDKMIVIDCEGVGRKRSGGLVLFWRAEFDIQVTSWSQNHIDVIVREAEGSEWRFTGIYGHPEDENKEKTGALMEILARANSLPWLCGGDFNLMLMASEKKGGDAFKIQEAEILRRAVEKCQFVDMGFVGYEFTWSNNRGGEANIQERLDRFLATEAWKTKFPGSYVVHLPKRKSDHVPILACVSGGRNRTGQSQKTRPFRFEALWLREKDSEKVVHDAWLKGTDAVTNLQRTASKLSMWSKKTFGNNAKEIRKCQKQMQEMMEQEPTVEVIQNMRLLDARMEELEKREEIYWHQRSRQEWLAHGDIKIQHFSTKKQIKERSEIESSELKICRVIGLRRKKMWQNVSWLILRICSLQMGWVIWTRF